MEALVSSFQCQFSLDFQNEAFSLCVLVLLTYPDTGTNFINVFSMLRIIVTC